MDSQETQTIFYDKSGNECSKPVNESFEYKILAKNKGNLYWISFSEGKPTDARKLNMNELKMAMPSLKKVSQQTFDKYLSYLRCDNNRISINSIKEE